MRKCSGITTARTPSSAGSRTTGGLFHSGEAFGDDEFFGFYRRVAEASLKTIPGAHREEEPPELDIVSIQPA